MSKYRFFSLLFSAYIISAIPSVAQTPVELHITHKLNGNSFSFNSASKNDLGNDFNVSRLEYYISKISIKHDGGMTTQVPNHYILVNGSQNVMDALGSFNITNVESVSFYIGVDTPINHADPSLQPSGHPLAPKSPSMHWGWSSGYRFVAMEGKSNSSLNQTYEIHALGDQHYFETSVNVSGVSKGGKIIIPLNADYVHAIKGIDVSSGLIAHGDGADEAKLLGNFRDNVFAAGFPVSVNSLNSSTGNVQIYPNPSHNGNVLINLGDVTGPASIYVYDIQGRIVTKTDRTQNEADVKVSIPNKGLYIVKIQSGSIGVFVQKIEILK